MLLDASLDSLACSLTPLAILLVSTGTATPLLASAVLLATSAILLVVGTVTGVELLGCFDGPFGMG